MRKLLVTAVVATIALTPTLASANSGTSGRQTKRAMEIILLNAPRRLGSLAPGLIDPRTRLLRANTTATCRGLGAPVGAKYASFRCAVVHRRTHLVLQCTVIGRFGATLKRLSP